jgi:tRNA dimethylallyltransferase
MILIILLGQTCSGKSQLAVDLAKYLGSAWIVNCDSRQVYQQLNLGTAKVKGRWQYLPKLGNTFVYQDIPHFLIDYVDPKEKYSLNQFLVDWCQLFKKQSPNLPKFVILTGGTGLFAKAISEQYQLAQIDPKYDSEYNNLKLHLTQQSLPNLHNLAKQIPGFTQLNSSDQLNPRRLVNLLLRYYAATNGWFSQKKLDYPKFSQIWQFAIQVDQTVLKARIFNRLKERLNEGLISEILNLNLDDQRLWDLGLEYRIGNLYVKGWLNETELLQKLYQENWQYARRQLTWLKKQTLIWIKNLSEILDYLNSV